MRRDHSSWKRAFARIGSGAAVAGALCVGLPAHADVIAVGGVASVSTGGDAAFAIIAVNVGNGTATAAALPDQHCDGELAICGLTGPAVSTGGSAQAGIGPAVSGTGCASSDNISVSLAGCSSGVVAVTLAGPADGHLLAVSGTGRATAQVVAVSGTGEACAYPGILSAPGVAVAGGSAHSDGTCP